MSENDNKNERSGLRDLPGLSGLDLEDIEKRLKSAKERTAEFVKEYPLTSVAIAVGAGILLGKLIARKK
jgi:ElaB/YqjD/DUF883 family membrane-anchored ribosome-binding protein